MFKLNVEVYNASVSSYAKTVPNSRRLTQWQTQWQTITTILPVSFEIVGDLFCFSYYLHYLCTIFTNHKFLQI